MPSTRQESEPVIVEVEVTEIDGVTHEADGPELDRESSSKPNGRTGWTGWSGWSGRVRNLDARWWPLWVLLGIIAVVLALTVGLVLVAFYLVFRMVFGIFKWIAAFLISPRSGGVITRR